MPTQDDASLKVTDRRHFTTAGERREGQPEIAESEPAPVAEQPAELRSEAAPAAAAAAPSQPDPAFVELLESLYATAMLQMGAPAQAGAPAGTPDLISARQTIEWIAALELKTRGNLALQEKEFFESMLYNLRLTYVELTRKLTGQGQRSAGPSPSRR